jgi:exo-beta-1,3-glucanase (GH17 family)
VKTIFNSYCLGWPGSANTTSNYICIGDGSNDHKYLVAQQLIDQFRNCQAPIMLFEAFNEPPKQYDANSSNSPWITQWGIFSNATALYPRYY